MTLTPVEVSSPEDKSDLAVSAGPAKPRAGEGEARLSQFKCPNVF
jgi:hypothetical protein